MNGSVYSPLECIENMLILGVCSCACVVLLILLMLDTVPQAYLGCCNLKESISAWTCVIRGEYHPAGVCAGVQDTALLSISHSSDGKPRTHSSMELFRFMSKEKKTFTFAFTWLIFYIYTSEAELSKGGNSDTSARFTSYWFSQNAYSQYISYKGKKEKKIRSVIVLIEQI